MSRYPFPIPFGWFAVGYPEDFPAGEPKPLFYFDRHLVAWRRRAGRDARDGCVLPPPRRAPRTRRIGRWVRDRLPVPRLAVRRRGSEHADPLQRAHQQEGLGARVSGQRAQRDGVRLVPPRRRGTDVGDAGDPRDAGRRPRVVDADPPHVRDRGRAPGDGRERGRLGSLPLRAQHRDGAGDGVLRDRIPRTRRRGRRRSSSRLAA